MERVYICQIGPTEAFSQAAKDERGSNSFGKDQALYYIRKKLKTSRQTKATETCFHAVLAWLAISTLSVALLFILSASLATS